MELFGTAGIRGDVVDRVTPELALAVGRAVGAEAVDGGESGPDRGPEFVVARDGRVTGPALAAATEAGLESAGATVYRAGTLPTPALAYASRDRRGVMLTASHNPPTDNGIKLFRDGVEYSRDAEQAVERRVAEETEPARWDRWGDSESIDPLEDYRRSVAAFARERAAAADEGTAETGATDSEPTADGAESGADAGGGDVPDERPLSGMRIAADCGNGVGALGTPQVLGALGAEIVSMNANVDGHFPGRESKPTAETLTDLREFVTDAHGTDDEFTFGLGHDGDADRIVIVGPDGEVVHEDTVVAILAEHYVRTVPADDPVVVTTPNASARIDERVREAGGRVERVALGYLHDGVADARAGGGDVVFAAEPWKHVHARLGGWIDGVTSAAVLGCLIAAADGGLAGLRSAVTERPYLKSSVECPDDAKGAVTDRLRSELPRTFPSADVETEYGVRLEFPDASWLLVRPSGTEPYVRVYVESDEAEDLLETARDVVSDAVESVTA